MKSNFISPKKKKPKFLTKFTSFKRFYLVLEENIFIYTFPQFERCSAKNCYKGIVDIKSNNHKEVFAFLTNQYTIQVKIKNRIDNLKETFMISPKNENSQQQSVSILRINPEMTKMVTICQDGKDIIVYDLSVPFDEKKAMRFYRGGNNATIHCLSFNQDSSLLFVGSSHGTIHIFDLAKPENNEKFLMNRYLIFFFFNYFNFMKIKVFCNLFLLHLIFQSTRFGLQ